MKGRLIVLACFVAVAAYFFDRKPPLNNFGMQYNSTPELVTEQYEGLLPCNDCKGIYVSVELRKDENNISNNVFVLKQTWLSAKGDTTLVNYGNWDIVQKDNTQVFSLNYDKPENIWYLKPENDQLLVVFAHNKEWADNQYYLKKVI